MFECNKEIFYQEHGLTMDSSITRLLADTYIDHFEDKIHKMDSNKHIFP